MQTLRLEPTLLPLLFLLLLAGCADDGLSPQELVENGLTPLVTAPGQANWNIEERMAFYGIRGVSYAVIDNNELVLAKTYGVTDAESATPVTEETLFQMSGGSRLATEVAALKMVSDGKLSLDGPINDVLESWQVPASPSTAEAPVTLRHLLAHSAGVNVTHFQGYQADDEIPSLPQVLAGEAPANTPALRIVRAPGSRATAANGGFAIVQQALVEVAGKPFPAFMQETVLEPLGMSHSTFAQPLPPERLADAATGHLTYGQPVDGKGFIFPETAASGLWTTPSDLAQVLIEILQATQGKTPRLVAPEVEKDVLGDLGTQNDPDKPLQLGELDRFDENDGFFTGIFFWPFEGRAVIVATNSSNARPFTWEVVRAVARAHQWPGILRKEVATVPMTAEELDLFTGRFAVGQDSTLVITRGEGRLETRSAMNSQVGQLIPTSEDTFVNQINAATITFRRERDGRAAAYTFRRGRNNQEVVYPRLKDDSPRPTDLLAAGRTAEGIDAYRRLDPPPTETRLNQVGYTLFNQGELDGAAAVFEYAAELFPRSANIYDSLGEIYVAMGEREKATEAFRQVSVFMLVDEKLNPAIRDFLETRARYYLSRLES